MPERSIVNKWRKNPSFSFITERDQLVQTVVLFSVARESSAGLEPRDAHEPRTALHCAVVQKADSNIIFILI